MGNKDFDLFIYLFCAVGYIEELRAFNHLSVRNSYIFFCAVKKKKKNHLIFSNSTDPVFVISKEMQHFYVQNDLPTFEAVVSSISMTRCVCFLSIAAILVTIMYSEGHI